MHHFSAEENIKVSQKAAKALKPGGYFVLQEFSRPETAYKMDEPGAYQDLYFNLLSTKNNWTVNEMKDFQEKAGLSHYEFKKIKGTVFVMVSAKKE